MGDTPSKQRMEAGGVMAPGRPSRSVVERFQQATPPEFREQINETWAAASFLKDAIVDLVDGTVHQGQEARLDPLTALGVIGCVTAQLFGYDAFHGQASPADVISALSPLARRGSSG